MDQIQRTRPWWAVTVRAVHFVVLILSCCSSPSQGFVLRPPRPSLTSSARTLKLTVGGTFGTIDNSEYSRGGTILAAKKKKRRKRKGDIVSSDDEDELPEFDLNEDVDEPPAMMSTMSADTTGTSPQIGEMGLGASDPILKEAMKATGSSSIPAVASAKDLLSTRDRSLEQAFEFDSVAKPLPKPADFAAKKQLEDIGEAAAAAAPAGGKKRAKAEARKAAAISARELERQEEEKNALVDGVLSKMPMFGEKSSQEAAPLKLLEFGTWFGIGLLVLWEIYINSPLFDRAAPMAPVVYTFFL